MFVVRLSRPGGWTGYRFVVAFPSCLHCCFGVVGFPRLAKALHFSRVRQVVNLALAQSLQVGGIGCAAFHHVLHHARTAHVDGLFPVRTLLLRHTGCIAASPGRRCPRWLLPWGSTSCRGEAPVRFRQWRRHCSRWLRRRFGQALSICSSPTRPLCAHGDAGRLDEVDQHAHGVAELAVVCWRYCSSAFLI